MTAIRKCIGCGLDVFVENSRKTYIYCKSCKEERTKQKQQKIKNYQNRKIYRSCYICGTTEEVSKNFKGSMYKCNSCNENPNYCLSFKRSCKICGKEVIVKTQTATIVTCETCKKRKRKSQTNNYDETGKTFRICFKCEQKFYIENPRTCNYYCVKCKESLKAKKKNKEIVVFAKRKHYGYYGTASDGHRWWSLNEQDVEEWLIANKIEHIPHKKIGNSPRFSDQYIPKTNVFIEIDGLDRNDDIDWYGKLSIYKNQNFKYIIVKPVSKHYIQDPTVCFEELNKQLKPILGEF